MFGYVRPYKPEMKFREFARYRSVYCGLCKSLEKAYGQIPRLTVTYDLTFLLLLIQALLPEEPQIKAETCVLKPVKAHPINGDSPLLRAGACASVLLAGSKIDDNRADKEHRLTNPFMGFALRRALRKARRDNPGMAEAINRGLVELADLERGMTEPMAQATCFGTLLQGLAERILAMGGIARENDETLYRSVGWISHELGIWVFLIDALDDYDRDMKKHGYSYLPGADREAAGVWVDKRLCHLEKSLERDCAVLNYHRDAAIIANIILDGLPSERRRVLEQRPRTRI